MDKNQNSNTSHTSSVLVGGTAVRLSFAPEQNTEIVPVVRDILKGAYLRSQSR